MNAGSDNFLAIPARNVAQARESSRDDPIACAKNEARGYSATAWRVPTRLRPEFRRPERTT